jgi:CSLREA domain-containing protein
MRNSHRFGAVAASLAILFTAACVDHPAAPRDAAELTPVLSTVENEWETFSLHAWACHEPVLIEGRSHVTWSAQLNGNRWHFQWHHNVIGSGVGEFSGRSYRLAETHVGTENVAEGWSYPLSLSYMDRMTLIGQGALANFRGQWRWHVTVNAKGTVTAQVEKSTFECGDRGPPGFEGTLVVNVVDDLDDGSCGPTHCSLREAIHAANEQPGMNLVAFRIPGPGPHTIRPNEGLPPLVDPVIIDGTSEPHFQGMPVIELDGSGIGGEAHGLVLLAGNTTVRGLVINRFALNGILIEGPAASGNVVEGNHIGTDVTGTAVLGNGLHGVSIVDAPGNLVGGAAAGARNVISGNAVHGVEVIFPGSSGNVVQGNYIGTDVTGSSLLGNGGEGVLIAEAQGNLVGGIMPGAGNVISGNAANGVAIHSPDAS